MEISKEWCMNMAEIEGDAEIGAGVVATDPVWTQTNCLVCGRFTNRHGACNNVFQVEPGIWEHG